MRPNASKYAKKVDLCLAAVSCRIRKLKELWMQVFFGLFHLSIMAHCLEKISCMNYSQSTHTMSTKRCQMKISDENMRNHLEQLHKTRYFFMWHDHSTTGGYFHFFIMVHWIYTRQQFFWKDTEYWGKYPNMRGVTVQSIEERKIVHILARGSSSDQAKYNNVRRGIK